MNWIQNLRGAAKCIAGQSPGVTVAEGRLAICADCPSSRVYSSPLGALLVCGTLGRDETTAEPPTCGCIVGACAPWTLKIINAKSESAEDVRKNVRLAVVPACKTDTKAESCPQGKWFGAYNAGV